ncbi:MAG TPA: NUDIX hydrolase [Blastocatellia bacterium]|nr:NUDIX hydrolase [Blastocatellia bacterium]
MFKKAITSLANLFQPRFTVTVAAVIVDKAGRVLLLKHRFRGGSGWGIPGGFLNKGEQPEAGLRRELREEIGLEIEFVELAFVRNVEKARQVQIIYICRPAGDPGPASIEVERYDWFQPDHLPRELSQSQRAIIERALSRRPGPR